LCVRSVYYHSVPPLPRIKLDTCTKVFLSALEGHPYLYRTPLFRGSLLVPVIDETDLWKRRHVK
ncbi:hypothetical protein ACXWOB_09725, partial [Streptococcus pyogenes]